MNLYTFVLLFASMLFTCNLHAQDYRVQLSAFIVKVPPSYFTNLGFPGVDARVDQNNIYRYYYGIFDNKAEADSIQMFATQNGFRHAQVIDMEQQQNLCGKPCPLINEHDIYIDPATEELYMEHIFFGFDDSKLDQAAKQNIDKIFRTLQKNKAYKLQIIGHTDPSGPAKYNLNLSKRRARTVRNHLISKGIKEWRIFIKVYGESGPTPQWKKLEGKKPEEYGRRVTLVILDEHGEIMTNGF